MSRAKRIEEAARELRDTIDRIFDNPKTTASMPGAMREKMRYLDAALAAPEDEGDVVERAADVVDTLVNAVSHIEWAKARQIATALHAAGLLAGPCQVCEHRRTSVREIGGGR